MRCEMCTVHVRACMHPYLPTCLPACLPAHIYIYIFIYIYICIYIYYIYIYIFDVTLRDVGRLGPGTFAPTITAGNVPRCQIWMKTMVTPFPKKPLKSYNYQSINTTIHLFQCILCSTAIYDYLCFHTVYVDRSTALLNWLSFRISAAVSLLRSHMLRYDTIIQCQ